LGEQRNYANAHNEEFLFDRRLAEAGKSSGTAVRNFVSGMFGSAAAPTAAATRQEALAAALANRDGQVKANQSLIDEYAQELEANGGDHSLVPSDLKARVAQKLKLNDLVMEATAKDTASQEVLRDRGVNGLQLRKPVDAPVEAPAPEVADPKPATAVDAVLQTVVVTGKRDTLFPVARALAVGGGVIAGEAQALGDSLISLGALAIDGLKAQQYVMSLGLYEPGRESFDKFVEMGRQMGEIAKHPIDFASSLAEKTMNEIMGNLSRAQDTQELGDWFEYGRSVGHATFDLITAIDGAVGLAKLAVGGVSALAKRVSTLTKPRIDPTRAAREAAALEDANVLVRTACFAAGTPVQTERGFVSIDELAIGDRVLSRDEYSGETAFKPVVRTIVTPDKKLIRLVVHDGDGCRESILATEEHPFWVKGTGWVRAAELHAGDELVSADQRVLTIGAVSEEPETATVYNIEVKDFHTYFVGDAKVFVHNADCGKIVIKANAGRNTAEWVIDQNGKLLKVSGTLVEDFGGGAKGNYRSLAEKAEQLLAGKRGEVGDQGGHAIAHRFLKDQGSKNLFPQNGNLNTSAFKTLENDYAAALEMPGVEIKFEHSFSNFKGDRPQRIDIKTDVFQNGKFLTDITETFTNTRAQTYIRRF
jgi:murein DD-endopeptidase MepM/ murein hydrolase activator NlpD